MNNKLRVKEGKVWGETMQVFKNNNVEVHRIEVDPHCQCSLHRHMHKYNMFFVESGSLFIEEEKDYGLTDITKLGAGQSTIVPPQTFHRFKTGEDYCVAYEIYWTEIDEKDIERKDVGKKNTKNTNIKTTIENEDITVNLPPTLQCPKCDESTTIYGITNGGKTEWWCRKCNLLVSVE